MCELVCLLANFHLCSPVYMYIMACLIQFPVYYYNIGADVVNWLVKNLNIQSKSEFVHPVYA